MMATFVDQLVDEGFLADRWVVSSVLYITKIFICSLRLTKSKHFIHKRQKIKKEVIFLWTNFSKKQINKIFLIQSMSKIDTMKYILFFY